MIDEAKRAYLTAFIDGEGHVGLHKTSRGNWTRSIAFNNTDKQLFERVVEIAADIGVSFRVYQRAGQKPGWAGQSVAYLRASKDAFERFEKMIPIQAEKKRRALSDIIASYADMRVVAESRRVRVTVHCRACGAAFETWPSYAKRGQANFCSADCRSKARSRKVEHHCERCGEAYLVVKSRGRRTKFCSARCRDLAQGERIRPLAKLAADLRWKNHRG